jgi:hypothetical protein
MAVQNFGKYGRFWEMKKGGPKQRRHKEIFKCTECGGETHHPDGWNGEPDINHCAHGCGSRTDWRPGCVSDAYKQNYDKIFCKGTGVG